jgi:hypothetical protein
VIGGGSNTSRRTGGLLAFGIAAHRFAINLRSETLSTAFRDALDPRSYLVPGNAPASSRQRARSLVGEGVDIFADNGHFDDIGRIARDLAAEGDRLHEVVEARERELGRNVRPRELDVATRDAYRRLAAAARVESRIATGDRARTLREQRAFSPTRLIGAEDITMAVWLALDIEPQYLDLPHRDYRRLNEAVARTAVQEIEQLPAAEARGYYAVASALDYRTAHDAGAVFARAGLQRAAMGFGAYMADDRFSDFVMIGRRRVDLAFPLPNRYLRTALVARGFWDGYCSISGTTPKAFHFLGLGAPIMLGPVALAGWGTPLLTYDATSPIRDAAEGTLYLSAPAPLKVRTRRIAQQLASSERREWNCPCPFCGPFAAQHPFDYPAGHAWHADHPGQEPDAEDLRPGGPLFAAFPLLSEPAPGELRSDVTFARMGHNHWALMRVTAGLNASSSDRKRLQAHVAGMVERYEGATSAPRFGAAVRFAYEFAADRLRT